MRLRLFGFALLITLNSTVAAATLNLNDIKWPPYFFPKLEQENLGIAKDLLNTCLSSLDYKINYKSLPIKRSLLYMQSGELDVTIYSYKQSREAFVVYGKEPLFITKYGFVSLVNDKVEINQLSDLYKYQFGNLAGLSHTPEITEIVEELRKSDQVSDGYDLDAMFGQLLAKPQRFQVMANSISTFNWRAKQLGIGDKIKVHSYIAAVKPYYVTVAKSSANIKDIPAFLSKVDDCLIQLKENGEYQKILAKYGL